MSGHSWIPFSPACLDCGAYRHGEDARHPCPGTTEIDDQEDDQ